jgi:uncharacterized lipoprotein YmbA
MTMARMKYRSGAAGLLFAVLALAGCSESQEPAYYVLGTKTDTVAGARTGAPTASLIGLRELALPLYARRTQIAAVGPNGAISMSDDHRWAEDPPRAVSRVVARTLTVLTGRPVAIEPWPVGVEPDVRVDIEVDYFAGALGGDLTLSGQYRIVRRNGAPPTTRTFSLTERSADGSYVALVDSHTRALEALARLVGAELR